jgi:hypothetical protein
MPKSYSAYTLEDVENLGLIIETIDLNLSTKCTPIEPSLILTTYLSRAMSKDIATEKAKSERIIMPILDELEEINNRSFSTFSGHQFNVDKALGLMGFCDFILSKKPNSPLIKAPIFCIVEAKNDNLSNGTAQCIAEMYAAQIFNQKNKEANTIIYGATTIGYDWKFLILKENIAYLDNEIYPITNLNKLLGVLNYIVNQ